MARPHWLRSRIRHVRLDRFRRQRGRGD